MRTHRTFRVLVIVVLGAGCMTGSDFETRSMTIRAHADEDGTAAHHCAEELRALAQHDARAVGVALDLQNGAAAEALLVHSLAVVATPTAVLVVRAHEEIARRESVIAGHRKLVADSIGFGVAGLDRATRVAAASHDVRTRLCEARDTANTLVAMAAPRARVNGVSTVAR